MVDDNTAVTSRLRRCFEHQRFEELRDLYADDAVLEVHVGDTYDERKGSDAITERYTEDFAVAPVFERWDERTAPWGAVVEAEAVQGGADAAFRYRWVHVLTLVDGRITRDTIYCTGAVPAGG